MNRRTRHVGVRFTPEEYRKLEASAHAAATELSALVRNVLLDVPVPARARHKSPDIAALGRTLAALNRVGNNINQIAKVAHRTGDAEVYREAECDRALLVEAARAVVRAIEALR